MLDSSKRQVDPGLSDGGFFGNFVLEVILCLPGHDEQAPVRQSFCENDVAILPLEAKQTFDAQTDRCDHWAYFRFGIGV